METTRRDTRTPQVQDEAARRKGFSSPPMIDTRADGVLRRAV